MRAIWFSLLAALMYSGVTMPVAAQQPTINQQMQTDAGPARGDGESNFSLMVVQLLMALGVNMHSLGVAGQTCANAPGSGPSQPCRTKPPALSQAPAPVGSPSMEAAVPKYD